MELVKFLLIFTTLLTTALAALKNHTQEFHLKTALKPNQPDKERFANLWLEAYHTGAGFNDAVMVSNADNAIKGFLNATVGSAKGTTYHNLVFDLGTTFPWFMDMEINTNFYAGWEPVGVNVGSSGTDGPSGFWVNGTGLQWTDALHKGPNYKYNQFGGWLVCSWWHGAPQLFFRVSYYHYPAPCSCADVYLMPEYI